MASLFSLFGEIFIENSAANKAIGDTVNQAETASTKTGTSFGKIAGAVGAGTIAVATATAAAAGAVWDLGTKTAEAMDTIDEGSQVLGISKEGYQEWKYILDQNGMSIDGMQTSMKGLVTTLTDGSAQSSGALDTLGLSLEDLKSMSQEDAFEAVVSAFQDLPAGVDKSKVAMDVFGKSGQDMLPVLNAAAGSLDDLKSKAHEYGMVMSDEAVEGGAALGDSLATLQMTGEGLMNQLGSAFVPVIQTIVDLLMENAPMISEIFASMAPVLSDLFASLIPVLLQLAETLLPPIVEIINQLLPFFVQITTAILPIITSLLTTLLPIFIQIVQMILPVLIAVLTPLMDLFTALMPILQPILDLILILIEPLLAIIETILPPIIELITSIIETIMPPITEAIAFLSETIGVLIDDYITDLKTNMELLCPVFEDIGEALSTGFTAVMEGLSPVITTVQTAFEDFSTFMSDVFAGNWEDIWEDIQTIFSDVVDGLVGMFKTPINGMIDLLNGFIKGLNKLKIPDWVPVVGGKGISLPSIPRLKVGMDYVPADDFPAMLHRGESVLTADEAADYRLAKKSGGVGGGNTYAPVINITINATDRTTATELLEMLDQAVKDKVFGGAGEWIGLTQTT